MKTWACPFFQWEETLAVHCEGATIKFKSDEARSAYIDIHCAAVPGWDKCPIADELCRKYEGRS